jgi:hypothetical protein
MITLITATVAANGVFYKLGFDLYLSNPEKLIIVALFFLLIIPSINLILLSVFLFEVAQMMQFGNFVLYHETKLRAIYPLGGYRFDTSVEKSITKAEHKYGLAESRVTIVQPLAWEQWLRAMKGKPGLLRLFSNLVRTDLSGHLESLYVYRILIFGSMAFLSSCIGLYLCWKLSNWVKWTGTLLPYILLVVLIPLCIAISKSSTCTTEK